VDEEDALDVVVEEVPDPVEDPGADDDVVVVADGDRRRLLR
jgi:hypothetical protein